jgi:UDP-glucose 4-epimerase
MKVLVTGASGLLGFELCKQLKSAGHEVSAVDNNSRGYEIPPCDHWFKIDLTNLNDVLGLAHDYDYIYHYSAVNGTKNFYERPNFVMFNNMTGDFNMFELAKKQQNLKKFVYASTSEIVSGEASPVLELDTVQIENIHNARWSYRLPKICSENYLFNSDIPWFVARYFNVYGSQSKPGHFVADQIIKIKQGRFELTGAEETRSFCHVADAMRATIYCAEHVDHEVINIGNDREITIGDAADIIASALGHNQPSWVYHAGLAGSTANRRPDISKLKKFMPDYQPIEFESGIQEVVVNGKWQ